MCERRFCTEVVSNAVGPASVLAESSFLPHTEMKDDMGCGLHDEL